MPNVYRGTKLPKEQVEEYHFDQQRGYFHRYHYAGMGKDQMLSLQADYIRTGVSCVAIFDNRTGIATLEVEDTTPQGEGLIGNGFTLDTWTLNGNDERLDTFNHPAMLSALTDGQSFDLLSYSEENVKPEIIFGDGGSNQGYTGFTVFRNTAVERIYSLHARGVSEFENDALGEGYVLEHSTNAPNRWGANISDFGVGLIYTTAQLLSEVSNSGLWINPLPGRLAYKLGVIPVPAFQANRIWGWKKSRSTESTTANNRIDIRQTYTLGQWSTDLYGTLS